MLKKIYKKIKQGLDKTDNTSYDLRPAADKIVAETLTRLKERNKARQSEPLVLLLGEIHDNPAHQILEMMVIQRLQRKGISIAVGIEDSYDQQPKNNAPLQVARLTTNLLFKSLALQNIPFQFNDAAIRDYYLETNDKLYKKTAAKLAIQNKGMSVHAASTNGMTIRNHIIAQKALSHAQRQKADIYIQLCGILHVAGDEQENDPYEHSLTALFKKKSCPVISVLLDSDFVHLPANHDMTRGEIIDRLPISKKEVDYDALPDWLARCKEKYILNKISKASRPGLGG